MDVHHRVMCVACTCYFSPLSTSFVSDTLKVIRSSYVGLCGTRVTGSLGLLAPRFTQYMYEAFKGLIDLLSWTCRTYCCKSNIDVKSKFRRRKSVEKTRRFLCFQWFFLTLKNCWKLRWNIDVDISTFFNVVKTLKLHEVSTSIFRRRFHVDFLMFSYYWTSK